MSDVTLSPPIDSDLAVPTGYERTADYFGSETFQLRLQQIHLRLSLGELIDRVPKPNPEDRLPHNRRIDVRHAQDFADYLVRGVTDETENHKYQPYVPAISLFTSPTSVSFESQWGVPDERFGVVRVRKDGRLEIWDGQHRVLGMHLAIAELDERLRVSAPEERAAIADAREQLSALSVPLTITLTDDRDRVAAIFVDMNDKQKGMASSVVARRDDRIVFNRVATALQRHDYLEGLVDDERDWTTANNENWTTLRDLAAIAKLLWIGYGGRWTDGREDEVSDEDVRERAETFLEFLVAAFPDLKLLLDDRSVEPSDLRRDGSNPSLLSSSTTIKALAVAYHDLLTGGEFETSERGRVTRRTDRAPMGHEAIVAAATGRLPSTDSGKDVLAQDWIDVGVFESPFVAPTARGANVRTLAMAITRWVRHGTDVS